MNIDISDPIQMLLNQQTWMEERVKGLWSQVSSFEELSASCISSILLDVANENFVDALNATSQFVLCLDCLGNSLDAIKAALSNRNMSETDQELNSLFSQTYNLLELLEIDFRGEPLMAVGKKGTREMVRYSFHRFKSQF